MNRTLSIWIGNCYNTFSLSPQFVFVLLLLFIAAFIYWNCGYYSSSSSSPITTLSTRHLIFLWEVWSTTVHYEAFKSFLNTLPRLVVIFLGSWATVVCLASVAFFFPFGNWLGSFSLIVCTSIILFPCVLFLSFVLLSSMATRLTVCVCVCAMHVNKRNIKRFNLIIRIVSDLCVGLKTHTHQRFK